MFFYTYEYSMKLVSPIIYSNILTFYIQMLLMNVLACKLGRTHFYIKSKFKIVVGFLLVASPIDVLVLVEPMVPMVSMIKTFLTIAIHFRLEQATLPLDRNRFSFQFQSVLESTIKENCYNSYEKNKNSLKTKGFFNIPWPQFGLVHGQFSLC